jgi:hypothetical protein
VADLQDRLIGALANEDDGRQTHSHRSSSSKGSIRRGPRLMGSLHEVRAGRHCGRRVWTGTTARTEMVLEGTKSKVKLVFGMLRPSLFAHVQPTTGADSRQ